MKACLFIPIAQHTAALLGGLRLELRFVVVVRILKAIVFRGLNRGLRALVVGFMFHAALNRCFGPIGISDEELVVTHVPFIDHRLVIQIKPVRNLEE